MPSFIKDTDRGWKDIKKVSGRTNGSYTKVGVQQGTQHKSKDNNGSNEISDMVLIASVNEFGSKDGRIPSRPALRNAIDKNKRQIASLSAQLYSKVLFGDLSLERSLGVFGQFVADKMKSSIVSLKSPPNKASTIKRKKSANPLVDTGQFKGSITHVEVIK